jgi:alpha-mannosidase
MEWYCTQNFVAASDPNATIVWTSDNAPLLTIGDINRDTFKSPMPVDSGHLFSYAFNNYWFTNYKASQGGEMTFGYSLTSMPKYDPAAAARFGESVRNPLIATVMESSKDAGATTASICSVSTPNVTVQAVKKAESGKGIIIRLRELSGTKTAATLTLNAGKLKSAYLCNLVEDPQTPLQLAKGKLNVTVPANGLVTLLITP